ncbi:hypothetical protein FB45DRAFT_1035442 [Roridomyces roridus]|uniref:F-box domain-containing protein n=1 Tax=Roridomyces roridus TaxID=1738132 RepID=A0AAD7BAR5_9AGAR|nr:hypothetical protein FB45DRAFT_1035442 [Roridomyces roridus]
MATAQLRARLAQIDAKIASLESQQALLHAERQTITQKLAVAIYPVLTLPHDVVSEIFLHCIDEDENRYKACIPVTLASVCSPWRAVALHTHGIWTHLETSLFKHPQRAENLLRMHVTRSGSLPLDLRIYSLDLVHPTHENFLRIFGDCSARWGSLYLSSCGPITLPEYIRGPFPHLRRLILASGRNAPLPHLFDAPNLVQVEFEEMDIPGEWRFCLPWSQLTTLRLDHVGLTRCIEIVELTSNLERLEILCEDWREALVSPRRSILLPRLHTLILGLCTSAQIIPHLVLPALREFDTGSQDGGISGWRSDLQALITRSGCALETLRLSFTDIQVEQRISPILEGTPTVRNLIVSCHGFDSEAFTAFLDGFIREPPVLLALEHLELKRCEAKIALQPLLVSFKLSFDQDPYGLQERLDYHQEDSHWVPVDMNQQDAEMQAALIRLGELRAGGLTMDLRSELKWFDEYITAGVIEELMDSKIML